MRKFLIPIVAAASALAIAAPASAQWAPPAYRYQPYNYGYGYNGFNFAAVDGSARPAHPRRHPRHADAPDPVLRARRVSSRTRRATCSGESAGVAQRHSAGRSAQRRKPASGDLEYRVSREATDRNNRPGYRRY